jgi:hypothetical protein
MGSAWLGGDKKPVLQFEIYSLDMDLVLQFYHNIDLSEAGEAREVVLCVDWNGRMTIPFDCSNKYKNL